MDLKELSWQTASVSNEKLVSPSFSDYILSCLLSEKHQTNPSQQRLSKLLNSHYFSFFFTRHALIRDNWFCSNCIKSFGHRRKHLIPRCLATCEREDGKPFQLRLSIVKITLLCTFTLTSARGRHTSLKIIWIWLIREFDCLQRGLMIKADSNKGEPVH